VVQNPNFSEEIETIGKELYDKTGISLYLVMVRDLDANQTTVDFEKSLIGVLKEPFVVLTFAEFQKKIDILARPLSLYKDFDKEQVLSPNATFAGAVANAIIFARSWDEYKELIGNYGGTILPVLAEKAKGGDVVKKYAVAMFNGYADIADQIAETHGVKLSSSAGNDSKIFLDILRLVFYGIILYALIMIIRNKMRKRKKEHE